MKKPTMFLLCAGALVSSLFASAINLNKALSEVNEAINRNDIAQAVKMCDDLAGKVENPVQLTRVLQKKCDVLVKAGRSADALSAIEKSLDAVKQHPSSEISLCDRALRICSGEKNRFKEECSRFQELIRKAYRRGYEESQILSEGKPNQIALSRMSKVRYLIGLADRMIKENEKPEKIIEVYNEAISSPAGDIDTKIAALSALSRFYYKKKNADKCLDAAAKIMDLAKSEPSKDRMRSAHNSLASAQCLLKRYEEAVDNYILAAECITRGPVTFPTEGYEAIINVTRKGKYDEALKCLERVRAIPNLQYGNIQRTWEYEARTYNAQKRFDKSLALFNSILEDPGFYEKGDVVALIDTAARLVKGLKPGYEAVFAFYDKILENPSKYRLDGKKLEHVVRAYGSTSVRAMDRARMKKCEEYSRKIGITLPEGSGVRLFLKYYDEMDKFPLDEKDLKIPASIADFGVDADRKIVHAKDFGWNPTNATECLQKAFDSDASTVIIDDMGSPWYIWSVNLNRQTCSNRKIIFKRGVKILSAPEHSRKNEPGWFRRNMFNLNSPTNLWIEAEGKLGEVYLGKYRSRKERFEAGFSYGGNCFSGSCRNTVLKNLYVANNGQDALAWGGKNSYVIDCIFDDNYRQGMSIGASHNCVYKNVTFCNTFGGEPHSGVDFEPYYEVYSHPNHYFLDCKFYNNACFNVIFATSTYSPITIHFKRCQFEASPNGNIGVLARPGIYMNAAAKAPSKIIFEDCRIDGYSDGNVIKFLSTFLFDMTFKNCVVNDKGLFRKNEKPNKSPIYLDFNRKVYDGFYPNAGIVTFDNFVINGYKDVPIISVGDRNGRYGVNTFRGTIIHNGKKVDMSKFSYLPPDRDKKESDELDLKKLHAPKGVPAWRHEFDFGFGHSYYNPLPQYTLYLSGKKGDKVSMVVRFYGKIHNDMITLTAPSGASKDILIPVVGDNELSFELPEDGVHVLNLNVRSARDSEDIGREGFSVISAKGADISYGANNLKLGRVAAVTTGDDFSEYIGYFEVPAGDGNMLKLMRGGIEIRDAQGCLVHRVESEDYVGSKCLTLKTAGKTGEIWSFRSIGRYGVNFKLFAPMPGIWSDDPESLPTVTGSNLPFKRLKRSSSSAAEMPNVKLFALPVKGAIAKAVDEECARRIEFSKSDEWRKRYAEGRYHYDWSEPAAQTQEQLRAAEAELMALEPVRKIRDMEIAAGRESPDLRRYVAFVSLYAHVLAIDDDAAAVAWVNDREEPEDDDFIDKVNAATAPYGIEFLDDGMYYEDYIGVVKIAPYIVERLNRLGVFK